MISPSIVIRRTVANDWAEVRDLRLEMLADTPLAFGETLEKALTATESHWRERARRGEATSGTYLAAIDLSPAARSRESGALPDASTASATDPSTDTGADIAIGADTAHATEPATARWVGTMGGYLDPSHGAMLVGVYVTPEYRGASRGVTDALLSNVEAWASTVSDVLTLHVHSENPRAIRAYERRGYVATGQLFPYILNPHQHELEMRKPL